MNHPHDSSPSKTMGISQGMRTASLLGILATIALVSLLPFACTSSNSNPPVLEKVEPKSGVQNQDIELTIRGQYLPESIEKLSLVGQNDEITLTKLNRISDTEIKATIPKGSPAGVFDLKMWLKDGKSVLLGGAFELSPNALKITFINVEQGDATLIQSPTGQTALIDAGTLGNSKEVLRYLRANKIATINHIIATHYDKDHVEGFEAVIKGDDGKLGTPDDHTPTQGIWDRGGSVKSLTYRNIRAQLNAKNKELHKPLTGKSKDSFPVIDLGGGVKIHIRTVNGKILSKDGKIYEVDCKGEENCFSLGTLVTFGKFRFWTAGDLTGGGINTPDAEAMLAKHLNPVDVYRAHHHGSRTSSNEALIKALKPQVVVISAGEQNSFCHPHIPVLRSLYQIAKPAFLLTTSGVTKASDKCPNSTPTKEFLGTLGAKHYVGLGTFSIVAQESSFSVKGGNSPQNVNWKVR